jgi:Ca-activated chloride channel family protein
MPASGREDALYFVDQLEASGGTNIHDALLEASEMISDSDRGMIVFITDGLPSAGVQDEGAIRKAVDKSLAGRARIFSFGVGYDVNTMLLDGLSHDSGAPADYISPEENIEERVSTFYDRVRHPLLTDLSFEINGADTYAFAPNELTDLYKGGQLIIAGRYRRPGVARFELKGRRGGAAESFSYDLNFPQRERGQEFVARLWATRRVGRLLDEIRMNGENKELKQEIVALAKEFGLVTPYTSYLVQEEEQLAQDVMLRMQGAPSADMLMAAGASAYRESASTGAGAVAASKAIQAMEEADRVSSNSSAVAVSGRTLRFDGSAWADVDYESSEKAVEIKMGSDAYFAMLRLYPEVLDFARLGSDVTFFLNDRFVRIGDAGLEQATELELRRVLG